MQGMKAAPKLRNEARSYLDLGTGDVSDYRLIGEGFSNFETSMNPITVDRHYIHEKSSRSISTGNAPSIAYELDEMPQDPVALYIASIHDEEKVGQDAVVRVVNVKLFREGSVPGSYFAKRRQYSVVPDGEGSGNGGEVYGYSGNFNALGDMEIGDWIPDTTQEYESGTFIARAVVKVPGAPTAVSATPGDGQAVITFTPPEDNGGSAILGYTASAKPATGSAVTATGDSSPITITGLTNGTAYAVTVVATNEVGDGTPSASVQVTPTA